MFQTIGLHVLNDMVVYVGFTIICKHKKQQQQLPVAIW